LWEQLDAKVHEKLGKNGVKVKKVASPARPQLRIAVDVLRLEDCKMCVFHVQTSLSRRSVLEGPRKIHMKPDVWKAGTLMAAVQTDEMPGKVTEVVLEQVERFVTCLLMANPDGFEVSDTDGISEGKVGKKENQAERPVRGPYPFVASKNSKVFHIAGCQWADTIKQENLIGFAKRAEALQSGRRPCRRCGGQNDRRGR
jgi:hypothetical protein